MASALQSVCSTLWNRTAAYNPAYALTIDPILTFSTYLGGSSSDTAYAIAVDNSQNMYVTGDTRSSDFPVANAYDSTIAWGDNDAFVTKYVNGSIAWSTFLGGGLFDLGNAIAVDSLGRTFIAGYTYSSDFPIQRAYSISHNLNTNESDIFLTRFNASGNAIEYSTYLGGDGTDIANEIALNGTIAYIAGHTSASSNYPIKNAYDTSYNGGVQDAIVAEFDTSLTGSGSLLMSSFLGGSGEDIGYGIGYEGGSLYIAGGTQSTNFPTKNYYDSSANGSDDVFVTKLSATTSGSTALQYSTYLGGSGSDYAMAMAVKSGVAYITGLTASSGFPTKLANPVKDVNGNTIYTGSTYKGSTDAFVAAVKTTTSGSSSLLYSTFLGGSGYDSAQGIDVEADGRATVVGYTSSANFTTFGQYPMSSSASGGNDVFIAKFLPPPGSGSTLQIFSSGYLGGSDLDIAFDVAVDADGRAYVAGYTYSSNFPTVNPQQPPLATSSFSDAFVVKVFPEYWDQTANCRWAHTSGTTTWLYYRYLADPNLLSGTPWRTAYETAVNNWNAVDTRMKFSESSTAPITFELYFDDTLGAAASQTLHQCSGPNGTASGAQVRGNTAKTASAGVLTHELGHAQLLLHISSYTEAIMGSNRTGISAPQALDIELSNTVYP